LGWVAVTLLATLPFLGKALHIDDPADLEYVRQILQSPLDPYGFQLDWDEGPRPAFRNYHPPLKYYYHAAVLRFLPQSEFTLHLSFVPFVALTAWAIVWLANRFGCPPLPVLILWMLGPGYLPGQNAMLDVPAMALGLGATALFISGIDRDRTARVILAGAVLGAALLTKYSALIYVPVWLGYLFIRGQWRHWSGLAPTVVIFAGWCGWTMWRYGEAHPWILIHRVPGHEGLGDVGQRLILGLVFLGGALPVAPLLVMVGGRHRKTILVLSAAAVGVMVWVASPTRRVLGGDPHLTSTNLAWWCWLALAGVVVAASALASLRVVWLRRAGVTDIERGAQFDEVFLAGWFLVALALGAIGAPFLAMRRVAESAVPGVMLLLRGTGAAVGVRRHGLAAALAAQCLLGFAVAAADYEWASSYESFARDLADISRTSPRPIRYYGYWGWTYYARQSGLARFVTEGGAPSLGTRVVIPAEAAKPATLTDEIRLGLRKRHEESWGGRIPIRLMNHWAGAGYYGAAWGPLPYAWSTMPLEVFEFFEFVP
jgi:hypothetical protein